MLNLYKTKIMNEYTMHYSLQINKNFKLLVSL